MLIVESLTLSLLGGLLGVGLAYGGLRILLAFPPANLPRLNEITIDLPVLVFAAGISTLSGMLFGLVPTWKVAGRKFASNLAQFVRVGERRTSAGKRRQRSQNALVVTQVALALVMLVGSGLTRLMAALLFGVAPVDGATFVAAAAFLAVAAIFASYIPARRAAAVDPAETLRGD